MSKKTWQLAVAIFIFTISNFVAQEKVSIIPQPNKIEIINAKPFALDNKTTILSFEKSMIVAKKLQEILKSDHQVFLKIKNVNNKKSIHFKEDPTLGKEAYQLTVNKDVAYQTFPRIAAYAEVGWTQLKEKNYDTFKIALLKMQYRWDLLGINYAKKIN